MDGGPKCPSSRSVQIDTNLTGGFGVGETLEGEWSTDSYSYWIEQCELQVEDCTFQPYLSSMADE